MEIDDRPTAAGSGQSRTKKNQLVQEVQINEQANRTSHQLVGRALLGAPDIPRTNGIEQLDADGHHGGRRQ
jgi:hypothetical protein